MRPLLLEIGDLRFHAYPAMLAVAFLVGTLLAVRDGSLLKKPIYLPPQTAVWALLGALFGAKVFWILQYSEPKYLWHAVILWEPGLVFYGGLIGGIGGAWLYLKLTKTLDWRIADLAGPFVALGEAITRIGCFLNGCCWGGVCAAPWGVSFPKGSHAYRQQIEDKLITPIADASLPVHPTQLYMTFGLVLACLFMRVCLRHSPFTGSIALLYMFLYGFVRFHVETFRGDSAQSVLGMTVSQTLSLALMVGSTLIATVVMHNLNKRKGLAAEEPVDSPAETENA